jgi:hypothetical protein
MADERAKHLRRLRRLRRSARGWSVRAGLLAGATAVLVPYHGLGLADAAWAAAAGGSVALAGWRWVDLRALASRPVPEPPTPELAAAMANQKMINAVRRLPAGQMAIEEFSRQRDQFRMRGLAAAEHWRRLDRAAATLTGMRGHLTGAAIDAVADAPLAERSLRDLAQRCASIERTIRTVSGSTAQPLVEAHTALIGQLADGVSAYERLVAAAAAYLAEDVRLPGPAPAVSGLAEAAELLRCVAESLTELRRTAPS